MNMHMRARAQGQRRGSTLDGTHHEDGPASVEAGAVGVLPDVFDLVGIPADEAAGEVGIRALDGFIVTFKGALTPSDDTT